MSSEIEKLPPSLDLLNQEERAAYDLGLRIKAPRIAPSTAAGMFELYLNGKSTRDIQRLNPGFSLAQVVLARVEGDWDAERSKFQANILTGVRVRAEQAHLSAITLVADLVAATVKFHGPSLAKYVQTGDEAELGKSKELLPKDLRSLRAVVDTLFKATGQDKDRPVAPPPLPPPAVKDVGEMVDSSRRQLTASQADKVLEALDAEVVED